MSLGNKGSGGVWLRVGQPGKTVSSNMPVQSAKVRARRFQTQGKTHLKLETQVLIPSGKSVVLFEYI